MHLPPSQHLTPFFDIRGWLKDTVDQAVQPLLYEISILKDSLQSGGGNETAEGRTTQSQAEVQVEAKDDVVKWHKSGCVIQGLDVLPDKAPPTKAKAKIRYDCFDLNWWKSGFKLQF